MSALFGTTLREAPADASSSAAALLARASYLRAHGNGLVSWLPLGQRALARVSSLLRAEAETLGAQEVVLPGGDDDAAALGALCRTEARSWRHLPRLLSVRHAAFTDFFLLDTDAAGLELRSAALASAMLRVLESCGARGVLLGGTPGEPRAAGCLVEDGDTALVRCGGCGYAAQRDAARFARKPQLPEAPLPLEKIATPGCTSIDDLCHFLGVERSRTAKAVFQVADDERFVFAVVRGDRELSEAKVLRALGAGRLRPATAEEIRAAGAVPGYASPIGLRPTTLVVADEEVPGSPNLVAGANETGFHILNTNIPRDYQPAVVADMALAPEVAECARCGARLLACRGIMVGAPLHEALRIERAGAVYQDRDGREQPVRILGFRFHAGRALEAAADACHDKAGLRLPQSIAPFDLHLLSLGGPGTEAMAGAERLAAELEAAGVSVLFDDRAESPGVKFADADLMGVPFRVTVSARALAAGGVELKRRDADERVILPAAEAGARILGLVEPACRPDGVP